MTAGAHIPLRFLRAAMRKGASLLKTQIATAQNAAKHLEPVYAKIPKTNGFQPGLRTKVGGRWYTTTVKSLARFASGAAPNLPRGGGGASVRTAVVGRLATSSPFASTLRPSLTGGAFPRTAGGYSIGGGARYFSHSPAAPAQVLSQVSTAMRAFIMSGKGHMDGYRRLDGKLGRIGVRAQLAAALSQEAAPGAYVDFDLSPTMTCMSMLARPSCTLENEQFLEELEADFDSVMNGVAAVKADMKRLSALGDLPVSLAGPSGDILRVHFRGCDKELVERLCNDVGVRRGVVHEDERFAFGMLVPGGGKICWQHMLSGTPVSSTYSEDGFEDSDIGSLYATSDELKSRITGSDSLCESYYFDQPDAPVHIDSPAMYSNSTSCSGEYEGLEGIHRYLMECEEYRFPLAN